MFQSVGRVCIYISLLFAVCLFFTASSQAASWIVDADGNWTTTTNWSGGVPNAAAAVADFSTIDITADRTVTLDAAATVGSLIFGDSDTTTAGSWIIADPSTINYLTLDSTGGVGDPTITVNGMGAGAGATISANLTGFGGLNKAGVGTLTLSGTNAYSGTTTLSAGTLNVNNASALGYSDLTINGGTIDNTSGTAVTVGPSLQTWGGNFTFTGSNNLNLGSGTVTLTSNRQVTVDAGTLTVGGAVTGTGYSLTKAGSGTLVLSNATAGAHTYGNTTITGGTISFGASNPVTADSTITLSGSGTISVPSYLTGYKIAIGDGSSGIINTRNGGDIQPTTLTGTGSTLTISGNPTSTTAKTATLRGSAWSTFAGTINFINATGVGTFWARPRPNVTSNWFTDFSPSASIYVGSGVSFTVNSNSYGNTITMGSLNGPVGSALTGGSAGPARYTIGALGLNDTFAGDVTGNATIVKNGTGTLILTGTNNYISTHANDGAFSTRINAGALQIGNGGATGTLGSIGARGGILNNASLVFNRNNSLVVANPISGTGSTTIDGGTIYFNSTVNNPIYVNGGATLGGQGSVSQYVTVAAGGNVEGGQAGTGVLTLNSLTYNGLGSTNFTPNQLTKTIAPLNVTDYIITSGPNSVAVNILGLPLNVDTYTLIKYGTGITNFGDFIIGTVPSASGSRTKNYSLVNNTSNLSIDLNVTGADSNITWTGSASNSWDTTIRLPGTTNWKYTNPLTGGATDFYLGDNVLFTDTGVKTVDISSGDVTPASVTFTNSSGNDYVIQGTNGIANGSYILKNGTGKVAISSANTYDGGTTINAGTISIASDSTAGLAAPLGIVPSLATPRNVILNGGALSASASLTLDANRGVAVGPTSGAGVGTIDVAESQEMTVAGIIANNGTDVIGYGTGSLTKTGLGTLVLNGANTFSGETAISGGVLRLGNALALQNSTLNYNNQGGTISFGTLTTATMAGLNGAQDLFLDSTTAITLNLGNQNVSSSYAGSLTGNGTLLKIGTGTFTVTGTLAHSGATIVNDGSLIVSGSGSVNTYSSLDIGANYSFGNVTFMNNATANLSTIEFGQNLRGGGNFTIQDNASVIVNGNFDLNNGVAGGTSTSNNIISLNGGTLAVYAFTKSRAETTKQATLNFNGALIQAYMSGTLLPAVIGLTANVRAGGAIIDDVGNSISIDQALIHDAALGATLDGGLNKIGVGTLILAGDNTYTGNTMINAGTLQVGNAGASGTMGTGAVTNNGVLTFNRTDTFIIPNAIGGSGSLIQQGYGSTAILTSPNTYTGATTVTSGTLALTGAQATSGVTVNTSGGLAAGAGGLTVNALTFGSVVGDTQTITSISGSDLSAITVSKTNGLMARGLTTIAPVAFGLTVGNHVVVDYSGTIGGSGYAGFNLSLPIRIAGSLVNNTANTSIDLNVTAVKFPRWSGVVNNGYSGDWDIGGLTGSGTPSYGIQNWKEYSTSNATVYQEGPPADAVYFDDTATGVTVVNITTTVQPLAVSVNNTTQDYTFSGVGKISGSTSLVKNGAGSLTIMNTGGNDYTGGTKISAGTLSFDTGVIPTAGKVTMDGGTLQWYGANNEDISGRLTLVSGKTAYFDPGGNSVTLASQLGSGTSASVAKVGTGTLTLTSTVSTFTGNVTVSNGTLIADARAANNGSAGPLGNVSVAGRTITVENGSLLQLTLNNVFGNQANVGTLPSIVVNNSSVIATRYNQIGNITLNGSYLTQSSTDSGNYAGYQFLGSVTVGGSSASIINTSNATANHLGANTIFDVADATGNSAADLVVETVLRDQSGDYPVPGSDPVVGLPGGLTKTGAGTMNIDVDATYTGNTTVNAGTLNALNINTPLATVTVTGAGSELKVTSVKANTLSIGAGAKLTIAPIAGGPLAGAGSLSTVPEPSILAMLVLAAMGLGMYWRRNR